MFAGQAGPDPVRQAMRAMWMSGDFGQIARHGRKAAEEFVERLGLRRGAKALDVACGTGNLAIPAARAGAKVTGADFAPNLLAQARQRAYDEGLPVLFDEADAEQLPYEDGQFDVVMSMFGAMFAARPERAAAEMLRVCRSGGIIAMANWMPRGFVAETFRAGAAYMPPPEEIPSPLLWGDEAVARQRFSAYCSEIRTTVRRMDISFPMTPHDVVDFFRAYFGPVHMTFERITPEQQREYAAKLEKLWNDHNETAGHGTTIRAEYLEVIAKRA